jgi:hypothetical protein
MSNIKHEIFTFILLSQSLLHGENQDSYSLALIFQVSQRRVDNFFQTCRFSGDWSSNS